MTVLTTQMSMRRLQMVAKLHRISLIHDCQKLTAGTAINIQDSAINVKYDPDTIRIDQEGQISAIIPESVINQTHLNRLEGELPECYSSDIGLALVSDGALSASWQPVGDYYREISDQEIDELVFPPADEDEEGDGD